MVRRVQEDWGAQFFKSPRLGCGAVVEEGCVSFGFDSGTRGETDVSGAEFVAGRRIRLVGAE
jgi:hypothetical protein